MSGDAYGGDVSTPSVRHKHRWVISYAIGPVFSFFVCMKCGERRPR